MLHSEDSQWERVTEKVAERRSEQEKQNKKRRYEQIQFSVDVPTSARMFRMTAPQTSINFLSNIIASRSNSKLRC